MSRFLLAALMLCTLSGCTGVPDGVKTVDKFSLERYLGTWYEIARLDHPFERGLTDVTAEYSLREDGGVRVINRGYDPDKAGWKQAEGKAYFVDEADQGRLKVSFFGPFYASYNIIALDMQDYEYALVCGPDRDYLWILARRPLLSSETTDKLVGQADELGFQTKDLIWVSHQRR